MFQCATEQKVCEIGGVKFGGQPGEYPCVCVGSIFQKKDNVFGGERKNGFNEKKAEALLKTQDRLAQETGVPVMADVLAMQSEEWRRQIDFLTSVSDMPFCVAALALKVKLAGAAYCAEKGLLDRVFYNSLNLWEKDLETEVREIYQIGVKHVLFISFDNENKMPSGRITATQRILDVIEKVGAEFESIIIDSSAWNAPVSAFCSIANRMIKEKWGFPVASGPSNSSYIDFNRIKKKWEIEGWKAADAAMVSLAAFLWHDMIFSGPMIGAKRVLPAIAHAEALLATAVFAETGKLPKISTHPLYKLFPDFSHKLKELPFDVEREKRRT